MGRECGQETWQQQLDVVAAQQAQQAERAARVEQERFKSLRAGARRATANRIKVPPVTVASRHTCHVASRHM